MEGLTAVFSDKAAAQESTKTVEAEVEKLHMKIGQLAVSSWMWRVIGAA